MDELPALIALYDLWSGAECTAKLAPLSRALAASKIDGEWWKLPGVSLAHRSEEGDRHWIWRKLVGAVRNDLAWEYVAVTTDDNRVQGAIGYRIDARSFLDPSKGTIYVDRLATAPQNRPWLIPNPHFRGVGKALLLRAVLHSYLLGLGGRVALSSLPSDRTRDFYLKRGFILAMSSSDDMMELPESAADGWLREEGFL